MTLNQNLILYPFRVMTPNQNLIDDLLQSGVANQKRIQGSKQEVPWINKGSAGLLCMGGIRRRIWLIGRRP